nr:uncharacterized protein LOC104111758 [Nicotiana tomentosiformis]
MVRTRTKDVPDGRVAASLVSRCRGRGRGRALAPVSGRGHPRVAPVVPPVDPMEDFFFEDHDEVPEAETVPRDFMYAPEFQEVIGRMLRFMDSMTQTGLFSADPTTSQMGGGEQTLPLKLQGMLFPYNRPQVHCVWAGFSQLQWLYQIPDQPRPASRKSYWIGGPDYILCLWQ